MKRILSLLLTLCLLVSFAACAAPTRVRDLNKPEPTAAPTQPQPTEPQQPSSITPALYKVTDETGNAVWLFGSIHVGLPSFYPLPEYVLSAYESADALAVECDVVALETDLDAQMAALEGMLYHDGTKISDHIPEALYTQAVEALRDSGSYMSALDLYKPVLWSSFIDNALYDEYGVDSELGIDMYFLNDAHGTGKEILEVESVQFQYDMLAGYSEELQILLLEGSVYSHQNPDEGREQVNSLLEAWSSGDAEALYALLSEEGDLETEEERELYAEYNDAMIVKRNISMADYAEEALASGKELFICVGAAHVVGAGAMADLLAQRGYTVERVTP